MTPDELMKWIFHPDPAIGRLAVDKVKKMLPEEKVREPKHCELCFEGCSACEVRHDV